MKFVCIKVVILFSLISCTNINFLLDEGGGPDFLKNKTSVYVVDYDMKQAEILMVAKGSQFNAEKMPLIKLHNEYFGGSMGSIVFQTLRESKL